MGKLGDILNKDIGSIASKILKADVGDIVKGAGRALNTDVGTIAKGAGNVLNYDLGDFFSSGVKTGDAPDSAGSPSELPKGIDPTVQRVTAPASAGGSSGGVADMQTASGAADQTPDAPSRTKFTEALVARYTRKMPEGSDLATLLPTKVGPFSRPSNAAQGDIATDPVSATYSGDADVVTVTLDACWDADEARDKQQRRQSKLENSKSAQDHSWSVGVNSQGVVFIWTRAHYCYEIVSPRGVPALTRFLADFPY